MMELQEIDFTEFGYPLRLLLEGNSDTWHSLLSVIEDLTPDQMAVVFPQGR